MNYSHKLLKMFFIVLIVLSIAGIISGRGIVSLLTDHWFFQETGYGQIFRTIVITKALIGIVAGLTAFIFVFSNLFAAIHIGNFSSDEQVPRGVIGKLSLIASVIIGLIIGFAQTPSYMTVLSFLHGASFGVADPIFHRNISFYVFSLPFFFLVLNFVRTLLYISFTGSLFIYIIRGKVPLVMRLLKKTTAVDHMPLPAKKHLITLIGIFFLSASVNYYLSRFAALPNRNPLIDPYFTGIHITLPMVNLAIVVAVISALLVFGYALAGRVKFFLAGLGLFIFMSIGLMVIPPVFQNVVVVPNELQMETPYIKFNIEATRTAFGLDNIVEKNLSGDQTLTSQDIENNTATIQNVRLWDRAPLLSTFSQLQEIRTYYQFVNIDDDRYQVNGKLRQTLLSARELAVNNLPFQNWINEHLTFTHGYGLTAAPVNEVTSEGLPALFVKDIPPHASDSAFLTTRPEIYFGELSNNYVLVHTRAEEFNYPDGEKNVYSPYQGTAGVSIASPLVRFAFALRFQTPEILLSDYLTSQSRIIFHRQVSERLATIAPFLTFDKDPYLVVADGRLFWIADAYTTTDFYPYSSAYFLSDNQVNYIRNSVKAVIDAYNGAVTFYLARPDDPIVQTYSRIFPGVFRPLSAMPASLSAHLKYPQDMFVLQTGAYATYHMTNPQTYYNKEDLYSIPQINEDKTRSPSVRHLIMKLPGKSKAEYVFMTPFTPYGKDNLAAWMVAENDGSNYGKLMVYRFPKQKLVFGPKQIIERINQNTDISKEISLWDQKGSQVIQGPLLVLPIEESLLYVRPLYLQASGGSIPELKRVIVAYEGNIAMGSTLQEALDSIFAPVGSSAVITGTKTASDLANQLKDAYNVAVAAQKAGDWSKYGDAMSQLGKLLQQMNK